MCAKKTMDFSNYICRESKPYRDKMNQIANLIASCDDPSTIEFNKTIGMYAFFPVDAYHDNVQILLQHAHDVA